MARILLIEPSFVSAETYTTSLTNSGYKVDHACNAQEAIHLADENTPDVVLLELKLKNNNGAEFLNEFRSHSDWANTPVIILSMVHPDNLGNGKIFETLGVTGHLYKPQLKLQELVRAVDKVALVGH